jgi:RHS repeat-associated protein
MTLHYQNAMSYAYRANGRLTKTITGGNETESYKYDEVGNRIEKEITKDGKNDTWKYSFNKLHQLTEIKKNDNKEYSYTYDSLGRQENQYYYECPNGTQTLKQHQHFDYLENGRLGSVVIKKDPNGASTITNDSYIYNNNGQRIIKNSDGVITKYFYSGSEVLMTADVNNHKISENVLTPGCQIITSQRFDAVGVGPGLDFYNYDIRRSTTAVINHAGNKVTGYQYDSFGNTKSDNDDDDFINETKFTGAIADTSTGLYYMNARYYNSNTGRFLSQDSYKGSAYEPWLEMEVLLM